MSKIELMMSKLAKLLRWIGVSMGSPSGLLEGSVLSPLVTPPFEGLALPCQEYLPLAYLEFVNSATAGVERVLLKESSERLQMILRLSV